MTSFIYIIKLEPRIYRLMKPKDVPGYAKAIKVHSAEQLLYQIKYILKYRPDAIIYQTTERRKLAINYKWTDAKEDYDRLRPTDARQIYINFK